MIRKKLYYWANDVQKNSGEGILAINFLKLLKFKYKNFELVNLNKFKKKEIFYYNYLTPFWGLTLIWTLHLKGEKVAYINYLPIWNFLLFLLLPKKTILGPITGTNSKKNVLYIILKNIGIFLIKIGKKNYLFSHNQFKKSFSNKKNYKYNFLLYNFKFLRTNKIKKFDIIFYYRKNSNKGNDFLLKIIHTVSKIYKVAVIGDKIESASLDCQIFNFGKVDRNTALKIIEESKFALMSKENNLSYFALDCLSKKLQIFSNKDLKLDKSFNTNMFIYIDYNNFQTSLKKIKDNMKEKKTRIFFKYIKEDFSKSLDKH